MKKLINIFAALTLVILSVSLILNSSNSQNNMKKNLSTQHNSSIENYAKLPVDNDPVSHPDLERLFFEDWHYPYGAMLPQSEIERMWREINALPTEEDFGRVYNSWDCIGPWGMKLHGTNTKYSGRINDIEVEGVPTPRVASASGGLWCYLEPIPIIPQPLSDGLNSLKIGSFDSKPGDPNTIFVGTGETGNGTGLWKTTNLGLSATHRFFQDKVSTREY
jgi:hypothetical protein